MRQYMQRLVGADEYLNHQIAQTFAVVNESDLGWTERIWATLFRKDGSLQIDFGLGKYHNRNVVDGFAGLASGPAQWTVRAGRMLVTEPDRMGVGPIDYEIVDPLKTVRFRLAENDVVPVSFDLVATGSLPAFLEQPDQQRDTLGYRISSDVIRYHQSFRVEGWLKLDGQKQTLARDEWIGFRDHSWGVRMEVGEPVLDLPRSDRFDRNFFLFYTPMWLTRPDGTSYELHLYFQMEDDRPTYFSGYFNHPDGTQVPVLQLRDELSFDHKNRRLLGGKIFLDMGWGDQTTIEIEPVSSTGFHFGTGLYFNYKGLHHGQWRGHEYVEGDYYPDCSEPDTARVVGQVRDCIVEVRHDDATGYGTFQSIVVGGHDRYGLKAGMGER